MLKRGDKGKEVKLLQLYLSKALHRTIKRDGDFGAYTEKCVIDFQKLHDLMPDGIVGARTYSKLVSTYKIVKEHYRDNLMFGKKRFVVFVDAGHGGVDDSGRYTTGNSKYADHEGLELHDGMRYLEGVQNREVAEAFIEECAKIGIMCIRTYHPYEDTALKDRTKLIKGYLRRGYCGYLQSFHSNAISSSYSKEKKDKTIGFAIFTTRGNNLSDKIAAEHWKNVKQLTPNWKHLKQAYRDGDNDYEANFQILRDTDLDEFDDLFGAMLEEWGFHTSRTDVQFIRNSVDVRVKSNVLTATYVRDLMKNEL